MMQFYGLAYKLNSKILQKNLNKRSILRIQYFHQKKQNNGIFEPLKQKKPSQNLNVEPALLNFKKNTSLPESSILIYVGSHQKWVVRLFFVIKISFISLVGLFLYLLYKNDFDIVGKLGPALKLENWEMVHGIFYDSSKGKYYMMLNKTFFGLKPEEFTKETISYTGNPKSIIEKLVKGYANFRVNGKRVFIEEHKFTKPVYLEELVGRQKHTSMMRQMAKSEKEKN